MLPVNNHFLPGAGGVVAVCSRARRDVIMWRLQRFFLKRATPVKRYKKFRVGTRRIGANLQA